MFSIFKKAKQHAAIATANTRHYQIAQDSARILETTLNPRTFFGRCDDIANAEERFTGTPSRFRSDTAMHTRLQIAFIDRLIDAGKQTDLEEAMQTYHGRWTAAALAYYVQRK